MANLKLREQKRYYDKKEQLLVQINSLSHELEQLRQTGQKERCLALVELLEKSLRELSALRQEKTSASASGMTTGV